MDKKWLSERHKTNFLRVCGDTLLVYSIIATTIYASFKIDTWWAYILAVIIIGSRQHALGALVHDGTHYTLARNRYLNDFFCDIFCAFPIYISTRGFRIFHLQHHRYTRSERDPEMMAINQNPDFKWPKTRLQTYKILLMDITGLKANAVIEIILIWSDALAVLKIPKKTWLKLKINDDMATFLDRTDEKYRLTMDLKIRNILFYGILFTTLSVFGLWKYYLLYWVVPIFTMLGFIFRLRGISEHNGLIADKEWNSSKTTIDKNKFIGKLVAPLNVNYHLEHHLYPQVPYFFLKELHYKLAENPEYLTSGGMSYSYAGNIEFLIRPK